MNHYTLHRLLDTGSVLPAVTTLLGRVTDLLLLRKEVSRKKTYFSVVSAWSAMTCKSVKMK